MIKSINFSKKITISLIIFLVGCSSSDNKCIGFSDDYKKTDIKIYKLERISLKSPVIRRANHKIKLCYPLYKYMNLDNQIIISDARIYRSNTYLIIAELYGVSDLRIMFMVDKNGDILNSYQYSMLSF